MNEIWKNIEGYEGKYQVSNLGRVKSLDRYIPFTNRWGERTYRFSPEFIMKQKVNKYGYLEITLAKDGDRKMFLVHRIVAQAFIPNPENKPQIDHIDGNKKSNIVSNLRWVSAKENCENPLWVNRGISEITREKMSEAARKSHNKPVIQCDLAGNCIREFESTAEAERICGYKKASLCNCLKGRTKQSYGFLWRYK